MKNRKMYGKNGFDWEKVMPDLLEIQSRNFEWFTKDGINETLKEFFPMESKNGQLILECEEVIVEEPKMSIKDALKRGATYEAAMIGNFKLKKLITNNETGEVVEEVEENKDLFFGNIPYMTEAGSFIINGSEKVVVSGIKRAPGAYVKDRELFRRGKTHKYEQIEILPKRGAWLVFGTDYRRSVMDSKNERDKAKEYIEGVIDPQSKKSESFVATEFLIALGIGNKEQSKLFGGNYWYQATLRKLKADFRNNIKKLELFYKNEHKLESDGRVNPSIKSVRKSAGYIEKMTHLIHALSMTTLRETYLRTVEGTNLVVFNTEKLKEDMEDIMDNEAIMHDFYVSRIYTAMTGEMIGVKLAKEALVAKFFNPKRYILTAVGREKINEKLSIIDRIYKRELSEPILDKNGNTLEVTVKDGSDEKKIPLVAGLKITGKIVLALAKEIKNGNIQTHRVSFSHELADNITNKYAMFNSTKEANDFISSKDANASDIETFEFKSRIAVNLNDIAKSTGAEGQDELVFVAATAAACEKSGIELLAFNNIISVKIYPDANNRDIIETVIGTDQSQTIECLTISDILAAFSYKTTLSRINGRPKVGDSSMIGEISDIDSLSNKWVEHIGDHLITQLGIGLRRIQKTIREKMATVNQQGKITPRSLINIRPLASAFKEFFNSSRFAQFMDETNPLSSLTNKRRVAWAASGAASTYNKNGRDINSTQYNRLCPIETPEGPNIGYILSLTSMASIDERGFIITPYYKVKNGVVDETEVKWLTAPESEIEPIPVHHTRVKEDGQIEDLETICRYRGNFVSGVGRDDVNYFPVSPKQMLSPSALCIPFLEHNDANRALMGANMQRQAVPLLRPNSALVGTGMETKIAADSDVCVLAKEEGKVVYVDANMIRVETQNGQVIEHPTIKYKRTNQGTTFDQKPIVNLGDIVKKGQIIADGMSVRDGELALGQNVTVAFTTWNGYNYEDAVIMSERLVKDDVYTSVHITDYTIQCLETKIGDEEITRDIPNTSDAAKKNLDALGIVAEGTNVEAGDILVGKITPRGQVAQSADERFLEAIFGEKSRKAKDTSLKMPNGKSGTVIKIEILDRELGDELPKDVIKQIKVFVAQKRKIKEGDKMAGRHGNKGVISKILPVSDMPILEDGTPVDIMLNPLGVPSRMNIGQVLEMHLGMAAKQLGMKVSSPAFDGATNQEVIDLMQEAYEKTNGKGMTPNGKFKLRDGRTGDTFANEVTVGIMHMIKLSHMVDDKLHARSVGPYSLITQQPLGGKAQRGGQRFGEMEVWALEAYGASNLLQEIMTLKSDDMEGRTKLYEALTKGKVPPKPGLPESFKVLRKELMALGLRVHLRDGEGKILQEHDND